MSETHTYYIRIPSPTYPLTHTLTGIEAGLLITTSCLSSCTIFRGSAATGGSWRCTLWHTKALFVITVPMVAATPSTEGGKEGEERGGRERKGRRSLTCNPQYFPIQSTARLQTSGVCSTIFTFVYLYVIHLFINLSGLPVTFPALSTLSCNNHKTIDLAFS